jgi:hypothetical protein
VPITSNFVNSNPDHGEVYSIKHYVIKFVSDSRLVGWFSPGIPVSSTNKTDRHGNSTNINKTGNHLYHVNPLSIEKRCHMMLEIVKRLEYIYINVPAWHRNKHKAGINRLMVLSATFKSILVFMFLFTYCYPFGIHNTFMFLFTYCYPLVYTTLLCFCLLIVTPLVFTTLLCFCLLIVTPLVFTTLLCLGNNSISNIV